MKRIALLGALLFTVGLVVPSESVTVPAWRYRVVNDSGAPVADAFTRQHWQDYSLEAAGHEQDSRSDADGWVSFPERRMRAATWRRLFGPARNAVLQGVHASYGPHSFVLAMHEGYEGWLDYDPGKAPPQKLVLSHRR